MEKLKARDIMKNITMDQDFITTFNETVIKQVVARDDEYTKQVMKEYAMQKSEEIGEKIRVDFIDKETVDIIIELGIQEYINRKEKKYEFMDKKSK